MEIGRRGWWQPRALSCQVEAKVTQDQQRAGAGSLGKP